MRELVRTLAPLQVEGDAYGLIFEYFMGQFAASSMQKRGEYVMANPPFNQSEVDRARLVSEAGEVNARFPFGLPTVNNANYLWIGVCYAALRPSGHAGFVTSNSASDAGGSERELRRRLLDTGAGDSGHEWLPCRPRISDWPHLAIHFCHA